MNGDIKNAMDGDIEGVAMSGWCVAIYISSDLISDK